MSSSASHNIAHFLPEWACVSPDRTAVLAPLRRRGWGSCGWQSWSFAQLNTACDGFAQTLSGLGIGRGTLTLLMVRPGLDFYALTFALFKLGAVPVLIDPGMGWRSFMACVRQAAPEAMLGIPAAHCLRLLCPGPFRSVRIRGVLGRVPFPGAARLGTGRTEGAAVRATEAVAPDDLAAVLFTTGSTGPAKGVAYTQRIFTTQVELLRREYGIGPTDVDLPCFPLFGLFSTALGATAVVPDMDPTRPARVDPRRIVAPVLEHGVTYSFGSPTLWARVGRACAQSGQRLPTLRRVIMAGAPVPASVHETLLTHVLPEHAQTYTPYGATEALPLTSFPGREMLAETAGASRRGAGICVGRPLPEIALRILRISDGPIAAWSEDLVLPAGEVGEVVVKGPVVTAAYHRLPEATRLAKIAEGPSVWHRMGDVGYLDSLGRLWFCGRLAHRVQTARGTLYSVCCEGVFNAVPGVQRSALVGLGEDRGCQRPVIVVEPAPGHWPASRAARAAFVASLLAAGAGCELTRGIRGVLFHRAFPVDIRHNAKIRREVLARWAERQHVLGGCV
jgi:acyl-CoA synthetase (AMP-forming)/AMP-acid ligase II